MIPLTKKFRYFFRQAWRLAVSADPGEGLTKTLLRFPAWYRSYRKSSLQDQLPWVNYTAIDTLRQMLRPDMSVFEYGTGGSTLFFGRRVGHLVSVEHDAGWAADVRDAMSEVEHCPWEMLEVPSTAPLHKADVNPADPAAYGSAFPGCTGRSFKDYASSIDRFQEGSFELVLVDGRARPSCAMHAIPKVAPGGCLMVDDVERSRYAWIRDEMRRLGWAQHLLTGPRPRDSQFHHTSLWRRPVEGG